MDPSKPATLTDPRQMRALAHPARIAILRHLALEGPATATECASVAGLSPSACSYHLRALARYGFIEEDHSAAADGRERPWRAKVITMSIDDGPDQPPAVRAAGQLLANTFRVSVDETRALYEDRQGEYPAEWSFGGNYIYIHVSPEELAELRQRVLELVAPYVRMDKSERQPDGRRVLLAAEFLPTFSPEEAR